MALHRDILWIGRQWAVTGHGMQLIDQRLEGAFDIEVIRLWDDDLIESLRAKAWLKADDFDKGLAVARTRYPPWRCAVPGGCRLQRSNLSRRPASWSRRATVERRRLLRCRWRPSTAPQPLPRRAAKAGIA